MTDLKLSPMEQVLVFAFRAGYTLTPDPNFAARQGVTQGTTQALPVAAPVATVRTVQPLTMAAPAPMARPIQAAPLMLAIGPAPLMLGAGEPAKRGPGRPKGSKNKTQAVAPQAAAPIAQAVKVAPVGMMPARPAGVVPSKPAAPQGAWSGVFLNMGAPQGVPAAPAHPPLSMGPATSAALAETGEATDDELLALLG